MKLRISEKRQVILSPILFKVEIQLLTLLTFMILSLLMIRMETTNIYKLA